MEDKCFFIVTHYDCDSTSSEMWVPTSKLFTKYEEAYSYFLEVSPDLNNEENERATQTVNLQFNYNYNYCLKSKEYVVIENRVQIGGYHYGDMSCAKRPYGAVIAICSL